MVCQAPQVARQALQGMLIDWVRVSHPVRRQEEPEAVEYTGPSSSIHPHTSYHVQETGTYNCQHQNGSKETSSQVQYDGSNWFWWSWNTKWVIVHCLTKSKFQHNLAATNQHIIGEPSTSAPTYHLLQTAYENLIQFDFYETLTLWQNWESGETSSWCTNVTLLRLHTDIEGPIAFHINLFGLHFLLRVWDCIVNLNWFIRCLKDVISPILDFCGNLGW